MISAREAKRPANAAHGAGSSDRNVDNGIGNIIGTVAYQSSCCWRIIMSVMSVGGYQFVGPRALELSEM